MKKILLTLLLLLPVQAAHPAADEAMAELLRMNRAAAELSYEGIFVAVSNGRVEAMQVAHQVGDMMMMKERLFALSGAPREIVRDEDRVWCFIPDKATGVHEYRQASESGFPRILPDDLARLTAHYRFETGGMDRIAGRSARQVRILPRDEYRYGYGLWADEETGLMLRSDLLDGDGRVIEQYLFVDIRIGDVPDTMLEPVSSKDELKWFGNGKPGWALAGEGGKKPGWRVERLPPGFDLSRHIYRMSAMSGRPIEHFVFTDGLASVSVFIKIMPAEGQNPATGASGMGAINLFSKRIDGYQVVVMGEVPPATVELIAGGVVRQP